MASDCCWSWPIRWFLCTALLQGLAVGLRASEGSAVDLSHKNFDTFLDGLPPDITVLMEFYANWCPSCQAFQPTYEQIAVFFNVEPRPKPEVIVARVDCAVEDALCSQASIRSYPTIKVGNPSWFKKGSTTAPTVFSGARKVQALIEFAGKLTNTKYEYIEGKAREAVLKVNALPDSGNHSLQLQMDLQDVESATILAFKYMLDGSELLKGDASRHAFAHFVHLVSTNHPVERCRKGAHEMHSKLDELWPLTRVDQPEPALMHMHVCGADSQLQAWGSCRSSREGRRGYTCGLWQVLHSLAARITSEDKGGAVWMRTVRGFVEHFFQCSDCAKHFVGMATEKSALTVQSRREAVLWMWQAHNRVNKRLEDQEAESGDADPDYPKVQWPPEGLCALCHLPTLAPELGVSWNVEEVYRFLLRFYGGEPPSAASVRDEHLQLVATTAAGGRKHLTGAYQPARRHSWLMDLALVGLAAGACFTLLRACAWWQGAHKDAVS